MLPEDVKVFLETQTMLREDLSYDQIKKCVTNLAQRVAKEPIPMDVSPFGEEKEQEPEEDVNSFGKGPAGGQKPGKGNGKGPTGKGPGNASGARVETRTCHNCGKEGHIAKDCRSKGKA